MFLQHCLNYKGLAVSGFAWCCNPSLLSLPLPTSISTYSSEPFSLKTCSHLYNQSVNLTMDVWALISLILDLVSTWPCTCTPNNWFLHWFRIHFLSLVCFWLSRFMVLCLSSILGDCFKDTWDLFNQVWQDKPTQKWLSRRSCLYSQIPRNRRHSLPHRATQGSSRVIQEAEEARGKCGQEALLWIPKERTSVAG